MTIHSWTHKPERMTDCGINADRLHFASTIDEVIDEDRTNCPDCPRSRLWELEQKVERLMEER